MGGVTSSPQIDWHSLISEKMRYYIHLVLLTLTAVVTFGSLVASIPISPIVIVHSKSSGVAVKKAKVKLISANETGKDPVYGSLTLMETSQGVYISGKILGLEKGLHGFHVHAVGDTGNNCKAAGGHFNPHEKSHGKPQELSSRHVGDLGNIESPDEDITEVKLLDKLITLDKNEINDITGRAFVVHAGEDDLGMGGNDGSLKTGNAGARLACGIVEPVNY